jgi:hypothetical protein
MAQTNLTLFNYQKVAKLEMEMWRAYYSHRYVILFLLLFRDLRSQFHFGWSVALSAAYYAGLAAADYRINKGQENFSRIEKNLIQFYCLVSENCTKPFDYTKAAELELEWWNIHRYRNKYKKTLEVSLAESIAVIFNGRTKDFMEYARLRAQAMVIRDEADIKKKEPDWSQIEELLLTSWRSAHYAIQR